MLPVAGGTTLTSLQTIDSSLLPERPALLGFPVRSVRLRGSADLLDARLIGVCGSREATEQWLAYARDIGAEAARLGLGVVAGDARGVDEVAQAAALSTGGDVVAVLPEGLASWRPRSLYREFLDDTDPSITVISQFPDEARWQVYRAMQRNRLVIGLSEALFVVTSGETGGTWEAGVECLKLHHPLFVMVDEDESAPLGNRKLIERGGRPVRPSEIGSTLRQIKAGASLPVTGQQKLAI